MRPRNLPSLDLHAEIETPDGTKHRWDAHNRMPYKRPDDIQIGSKMMEGHADGSCRLARRSEVDWNDLGLYSTVRYFGMDGSTAYEGRVAALPVDSQQPSIEVRSAGWMTHALDRPAGPILYIDSSFERWQAPSVEREQDLASGSIDVERPSTVPDDTGQPALKTSITGAWARAKRCEAFYDAGGLPIGSLYYAWKKGTTVNSSDINFNWRAGLGTNDTLDLYDITAALRAAGPSSDTLTATDVDRTYAFVFQHYDVAAGSDGMEYPIYWTCLAVIGDQNLPLYGTADYTTPQGLLASDMIRHSCGLYAPMLDTSRIQDSAFIITQAAEFDLIGLYDLWLKLNRYDQYSLAVWDDRKLYYEPFDTESVTWRVRSDEPGVRVRNAGRSADSEINGVIVKYVSSETGRTQYLSPDDDTRLANADPNLDCNKANLEAWKPVTLKSPETSEGAIQYGNKVLNELSRKRSQGQIVVDGHIQDDAGNWHPGWATRAHDTVLVEDQEGNPQVIHEARWDARTKRLALTVDGPSESTDAVLDRVMTEVGRR